MRSDDMTFFHEGTMRICGSLDIDEVLRDCLAFIKKYMPAEGIQLCIYEEKFRGIRVVSMASDMELREFDPIIPLLQGTQEIFGYIPREAFLRISKGTGLDLSSHLLDIASGRPQKAPLVWGVKWLYRIMIPLIMLGLILHILLHLWRYRSRRA